MYTHMCMYAYVCKLRVRVKEIYCKAATPPTVDRSLGSDQTSATIYVPRASVEKYRATDPWCIYNITGYDF